MDRIDEILIAKRLRQKLNSPSLHCTHRHRNIAVRRYENHRQPDIHADQFSLKIQPALSWQTNVQHETAGNFLPPESQELLTGRESLDVQPDRPDETLQCRPDRQVIIDDKDSGIKVVHWQLRWAVSN